jgi:hypothetical protein
MDQQHSTRQTDLEPEGIMRSGRLVDEAPDAEGHLIRGRGGLADDPEVGPDGGRNAPFAAGADRTDADLHERRS